MSTPPARDAASWGAFLDRLLLLAGSLLLASGVVFFFAYNWDRLGRLSRLGLAGAALALALSAAAWLGVEGLPGKSALLLSSLLVGALLAVFGQVYQTGADSWELFRTWTLLALPLALVSRFAPCWLLTALLADAGLALFIDQTLAVAERPLGDHLPFLALAALNGAALAAWELLSGRLPFLSARWGPRILFLLGLGCVSLSADLAVVERRSTGTLAGLPVGAWLAVIAASVTVYQRVRRDLFMLAAVALSAIVFVATLLARWLFDAGADAVAALVVALAVIGLSALAVAWLRRVSGDWSGA